ncbi:GNAT family N-acetyltransferase [Streptomyces sp. NA04227]|uniref:GNAT family N-acetyltransferase n=1 Tax=Streptomyces sp. NA04227 TaxID=2742136 RepID=UPI0015906600|nr:GNAT family N-acetyltransferase [Streptomyces sp. NA04227]QKW07841.1 GNAT family N-acetyltransferase [Streptomyces sp. NA04227]
MSTPDLLELPIRRLSRRDLLACADLAQSRGWSSEEHKWGFLLTAGAGFGVDDPSGEGLACVCTLTRFGTYEKPELGAIGMVLVAEHHQRRGLGLRLMRHVLAESGAGALTLHATSTGRPLYERLGFREVTRAETLVGRLADTGPVLGIATRPASAEDLPAILRLDAEIFGLDRTHLITRLPAFAHQFRVAEARGRLTGFAASWPNTHHDVIGPLIAEDTATARALFAALAAGTARELRTDIDVRHEELLGWAGEQGLRGGEFTTVMLAGAPVLPGDWRRRFAPLTVAAA